MALEHVLLRDTTAEINTGTEAVPNWVEILGIDKIERKPKATKKDCATTKSGGNEEHRVTERGDTWTLKGQRIEDPDSGARDPGQEAVEALGNAIGYDSVKQIRMSSPGAEVLVFWASAVVTPLGGDKSGFSDWEAELERSGAYV